MVAGGNFAPHVRVQRSGIRSPCGGSLYVRVHALRLADDSRVDCGVRRGFFDCAPLGAAGISRKIASPLEYLLVRYNAPTRQLLAWSGLALKVFDVGAKWASIAVILNVFTGIPLVPGILISVVFSLFYITCGGLWGAAITELVQFAVQFVAGIVMLIAVLAKLGGIRAIDGIWRELPPGHSHLFNGPFTPGMALAYVLICFLSYNGGTWNLAQRYIASPTGTEARKAAFLSAALYLLWPLVLFFPMWAAPLLFPNLPDPTQSYSIMVKNLLPRGLIGLVLASLFAHTMAMTTSDANIISAVVTRDILPAISRRCRDLGPQASLRMARGVTVAFTLLTVIVAVEFQSFGGILGLLVLWFGALVGPTSVPMILGLMPAFRHSGATAAIVSWAGGIATLGFVKYGLKAGMGTTVAAPVLVSLLLFIGIGWLSRDEAVPCEIASLLETLKEDQPAAPGVTAVRCRRL